jgi:hypothetical protein
MSEEMTAKAAVSTPAPAKSFGIVGVFDTPAQIYQACEAFRDAGFTHFDAHTPFPVHGLERAMGLRPSKMSWIFLAGGITGLLSMIALAFYTQHYDYPQNISGKNSFSWQAFVPLFFEFTVLFSALFGFFGLWVSNKLPMFYHPVMKHPNFPRATDDKFLLAIEARDPKFEPGATRALLEKCGALDIHEVTP